MENIGYPCPACGAPADLARGCPGCGRPPNPDAAEVIRLDREIVALTLEVERARQAYQELVTRLETTRSRRAELAARVRAALVPGPARPVGGPAPVVPAASPGRPEASTRTVQGLLFVLGGLLLGTAAVVFTAVAWATVGVAGRALILAAFTALALAAPLVAVRRGLRGTAETFAAVGLLLVVLDGYAAWTVDLFGVSGWPTTRYAALVGGASVAVAAGYARLSRLAVPWFAALLTVQPVLPLLAVEARPNAEGWTAVFAGVALVDLAVLVALRRHVAGGRAAVGSGGVEPAPGARIGGSAAGGGPVAGPPVPAPTVVAGQVLAWTGYGAALTVAAACALVPLAVGRAAGSPLLAGLPLLLVTLVLLGGALLAGGRLFRVIAAGLLVPVLAGALVRPVGELRPALLLVAAGLVVAGLAGAVRLLPERLRTGPRVGALVVAGGLALPAASVTFALAGGAVGRSLPPWHGAGAGPAFDWGWQLPVAMALTAGAVALLLPRAAGPVTGAVGLVLTVLAAPAAGPAPWPAVLAGDLTAGGALLLAAVARPGRRSTTVLAPAVAGALLVGHALLVGLAAPAGAGAALGVVLSVGLTVAARARRGTGVEPVVAGVALAAALLAVPAGVAVGLIAAGASPWWQARGAVAAAALLLGALVAVRRHWPDLRGYASTALAVTLALAGLAPLVVPAAEPVALYAALAVLLATAADPAARPADPLRVVGAGLALVAVVAAAPVTLTVLVTPYDGPVRIWSGAPGVVPVPGALPAGLALLVLAAAAALVGRPGRVTSLLAALPFVVAALPVLLVAVGAPWPVVPAVALLTGVAALLAAALARPRPLLDRIAVPVGTVWAASGLAGLLATRAGTLAGLGVLTVSATVAGVAGRRIGVRLAGCLAAVAAATCFAVTAPLAGGLPLRSAAFAVLGVAALVLAAAGLSAGRESLPAAAPTAGAESLPAVGPGSLPGRALDAAAQAVALLALLLTDGAIRHAAAVSVLWGAAVALRVLRRGESAARRWAFAGIAGGSELLGAWLLLAAGRVVLLEAYTVPAAALALGAGLVALRTRPGLNSWLALGPGLAAGLLPSLVSVLVAPDPQPWRRLLLGAVALGVLLAGAVRRWQAPVLLGGVSLALLALHELVRSWDLLPRWIFLAVGGFALIALAATYERRRRDLARLRSVVGRMG